MRSEENTSVKVSWQGKVVSIQPRTRVWRYLTHNRTHYLLGYNLFMEDNSSGSQRRFAVAISESQQEKGQFRTGDVLAGTAWTKKYEEREYADYYRAGSIKLLERAESNLIAMPPPWVMLPPAMETYERRGARMLSKNLWETKCFPCIWANMANVEIQWDFDREIKRYRFETFCYGPKSCKYYNRGRPRAVPYKNRDSAYDDGGLDDICTDGRDEDE